MSATYGLKIGKGIGSATPGSLLLVGTGGKLYQLPTKLFYDLALDYLGIGTNAPQAPVHIYGVTSTQLIESPNANDLIGIAFSSLDSFGTLTLNGASGLFPGLQLHSAFDNRSLWLEAIGANADIGFITGSFVSEVIKWRIKNAGHIFAELDNAYDIGAASANRPRKIYVATAPTTADQLTRKDYVDAKVTEFFVESDNDDTRSAATYADLISVDLTVSGTGDVFLLSAAVCFSCDTANGKGLFAINVDGTDIAFGSANIYGVDRIASVAIQGRVTGLAAGTRAAKIRWKSGTAGQVISILADTQSEEYSASLRALKLKG